MAPEVALSQPYTELVDIYSLGIIIWQMATGLNPYSGLNKEIFKKLVLVEHQRPPLDLAYLSEPVRGLLQQCWAPDWRQRPKASDVLRVLSCLLSELPPPKKCFCF